MVRGDYFELVEWLLSHYNVMLHYNFRVDFMRLPNYLGRFAANSFTWGIAVRMSSMLVIIVVVWLLVFWASPELLA